ncbi:MAG: 2,3-bisphosphoglycerate-independent phosphoglycerate mutase [Nanoarchaeota archaeon]|nr:2,3-bisphosphoglycerate-independent phosphoglycerate mutase [Nanoarchaeota archaeon]
MVKKGVILVIRDGWGYSPNKKNNAIANANTPNTDFLTKTYPSTLINASGEAVGLPPKYQGNSEVGHMTIGSGRIMLQSLKRINNSIKNKNFFKLPEFLLAIENCKEYKTALHIAGLLQKEGVHSHIDHLFALLDLCQKNEFHNVKLHLFTDGRDSPVHKSLTYITQVENKLKDLGFGEIATICGRYYAMDRDNRWKRTQKTYDCIVLGKSDSTFTNVKKSIKESHKLKITDEFIVPIQHKDYEGIQKNDSFIFYNFRTDRTRQLTKSIVETSFIWWKRKKLKVFFVAMTSYYNKMNAKVAFKKELQNNLLGNIVSDNELNQLRISETEKYAHVTFFFNGQIEKPNKNESRILINSPRVSTYDLKPEMSVYKITTSLIREIKKDKYNLIVVNLVNGDMVGHTGNIKAIIKAVESVDECLGKIVDVGLKKNYDFLIFGDHGNAENQNPNWVTSHTINPVPLIFVSNKDKLNKATLLKNMGLRDIAPTTLKLLGLPKPKEMTGSSIIK